MAVLLSNVSLLELLQKVLECTWTWSFPSEPTYLSSEDALLSSGWLLAASLLIYQHRYNTEVRAILVQIHGLVKILKKNSFLAGESGLFWPGICLSLLLFCYCLQVILYCAFLQLDWKLACYWRVRHKSLQLEMGRNAGIWGEWRGKHHTQPSRSKPLSSSG